MNDTPSAKRKILIVEDDQFLRELYVELLTNEGYAIEEAVDGDAAYVKMLAGGYDLVLFDIMLPKMDGLKLLEKLQKETPPQKPNGPIVILSNLDHDSAIVKAIALGAKGYMIKSDHTPDDVIKQVKSYLGE